MNSYENYTVAEVPTYYFCYKCKKICKSLKEFQKHEETKQHKTHLRIHNMVQKFKLKHRKI
jgi:hypothetical protein